MKEKLLWDIISESTLSVASRKVERYTKHYEVLVGIGDDEVATITLPEEAYIALMKRNI